LHPHSGSELALYRPDHHHFWFADPLFILIIDCYRIVYASLSVAQSELAVFHLLTLSLFVFAFAGFIIYLALVARPRTPIPVLATVLLGVSWEGSESSLVGLRSQPYLINEVEPGRHFARRSLVKCPGVTLFPLGEVFAKCCFGVW